MITSTHSVTAAHQRRALISSTLAFAACFAIWTIFSIIGVQIKKNLNLSETQFGLLIGTPILTGSLSRLLLGVWADQYGGRIVYVVVMISAAVATFLLTYATTYDQFLLAALGIGISGGSFAVGVAYVSKWYPKEKQGTALGIFGMGNIGAAITVFFAPFVMVAYGWERVAEAWAVGLVVITALFWLTTADEPSLVERRLKGEKPKSTAMALAPLKKIQVWRFSLYYFFVFGGFVALTLWFPRYYIAVYGLDIKIAGMLGAIYSITAAICRGFGGYLADKQGARKVMYLSFIVSMMICFLLSYPPTDYVIYGIRENFSFRLEWGIAPFAILTFLLGLFMSLGTGAVFKHIPVYYSDNVGSVGGLVGLIGGLGGFFLPVAFGFMNDWLGIWTSCFMLLFLIVGVSLLWMHLAILQMEREKFPELQKYQDLPQIQNGESK